MKILASKLSPVNPLCNCRRPSRSYPCDSSCSHIYSNDVSRNMVPSPRSPVSVHKIASKHSLSWPIVMRDGIACGFTIMSGVIPSSVNGMSSCGNVRPITPFWPMRLENLSPTIGVRVSRILTFTMFVPSLCGMRKTVSTTPLSWRRIVLLSRLIILRAPSPISVVQIVFESNTSLGFTCAPTHATPYSSRRL